MHRGLLLTTTISLGALLLSQSATGCSASTPPEAHSVEVLTQARAPDRGSKKPAVAISKTTRRIQCGENECFAGSQHCCAQMNDLVARERQCAPIVQACDPGWTAMDCDDASDCAEGLRCCTISSGLEAAQSCMTRCLEVEVCSPGAACLGDGQLCIRDSSYFSRGVCVTDHPLLECGNALCKAPYDQCCWDTQTASGRCAARDPRDPNASCRKSEWAFTCSGTRDCGEGLSCCQVDRGSQCRGLCTSGVEYCRELSDCSGQPGKAVSCDPPKLKDAAPPGVGVCNWEP